MITVTTVDGGYTAQCAVKVLKKETPSTDGDNSSDDGGNDRKEPDADWDSIAFYIHMNMGKANKGRYANRDFTPGKDKNNAGNPHLHYVFTGDRRSLYACE